MVESTKKEAQPIFRDISPRNRRKDPTPEEIEAAKKKKEEQKVAQEEERKRTAFRDRVFEHHRSSSRSASTSSAKARRERYKMQETVEGFVSMVDGYNQAIIDFNETAASKAAREEELETFEFETAQQWVKRFKEKYNRWPNPTYFRYAAPQQVDKKDRSKSPRGSGMIKSQVSMTLSNQRDAMQQPELVQKASTQSEPMQKRKTNIKGINIGDEEELD